MSSTEKISAAATFARRLRELRQKAGLSKAAAARELGFSAQRYQRYEDGRIPEPEILMGIAGQYGVSMGWLLGADAPDVRAVGEPQPEYAGRLANAETACRIPASCDLPARLDTIEADLARMSAQMETLIGLLGRPLRSAIDGAEPNQKAG